MQRDVLYPQPHQFTRSPSHHGWLWYHLTATTAEENKTPENDSHIFQSTWQPFLIRPALFYGDMPSSCTRDPSSPYPLIKHDLLRPQLARPPLRHSIQNYDLKTLFKVLWPVMKIPLQTAVSVWSRQTQCTDYEYIRQANSSFPRPVRG